MTIDGAIVREQGQVFGIIIVKPSAKCDGRSAAATRAALQSALADFQGIPLILASQDSRGVFSYEGRRDIVQLLASIDASRIPWKRYRYA